MDSYGKYVALIGDTIRVMFVGGKLRFRLENWNLCLKQKGMIFNLRGISKFERESRPVCNAKADYNERQQEH